MYDQNKRHTNNFIAQTIFALDFDDSISLTDADNICRDFDLNYLFGYYTYRHTDLNPRFRLVFVCDGEVRDSQLAKDLLQALTYIFKEKNDTACLDLARIWAGTNKEIFRGVPDSTFNPKKLFRIANELKYSLANGRSRKLYPIDNIEETGNNGSSIVYKYRINSIPLFCDEFRLGEALVDNWKPEDLFECRLFKTFYEGKGTPGFGYKLNDAELFCLASNLRHLMGGEKFYKACLDKNPHYSAVKYHKISWLRNQKDYRTCLIGKHSPFQEDQINPSQTFPELLRKKGKVEIDPSYKVGTLTLSDGEAKIIETSERIRTEDGNKVYVMRLSAGLGKSMFWRNQKGVVMGFPSNNLKKEHFDASALMNTEKLVTPEALSGFSEPVNSFLNNLYQKGLGYVASILIKDLANGESIIDGTAADDNDIISAAEYLYKKHLINGSDASKTVFTTHSRMVHESFKQDIYVFDENPLGSMIEQHKTTIKEILMVIELLKLRGCDVSILEDLLIIQDSTIHSTPDFRNLEYIVREIVRGNKFTSNVINFFHSSTFSLEGGYIHYQVNHLSKLPTDKKLVFLDATASEVMYRKIFGDRLEFIDISNVELKGKILQYTSRSCSKTGLDIYHEKISTQVRDSPVITFKGYKKYFKNPDDDLHFGNAIGSNKLEGKDFCVVGTMTYHPMYFRFLADMLHIDCKDFKMKPIKVNYNGRIFWFTTFKNAELQRLHLEQVEGELIQCVHRARLIRTDATVTLYSNFPLLQAQYIY